MELLSLLDEVVDEEQVNNSEVNTETEVEVRLLDEVVVVEGIEVVVLTRLQIPESFSRFLTFLR